MSQHEHKQSVLARLRGRLFHIYFRLKRPMTLGVRGLCLKDDAVFLIRHTYVPGWQLPGGGVETGESLREALDKELMEEGNIRLTGEPQLIQVYFNRRMSKRDHVALFVCRDFEQTTPKLPDHEIAESGFFPVNALPEGTTRATRERIAEVLDGRTASQDW
jgi:ADP-ribose pyrophosphatase YjhB (NUDIX family)